MWWQPRNTYKLESLSLRAVKLIVARQSDSYSSEWFSYVVWLACHTLLTLSRQIQYIVSQQGPEQHWHQIKRYAHLSLLLLSFLGYDEHCVLCTLEITDWDLKKSMATKMADFWATSNLLHHFQMTCRNPRLTTVNKDWTSFRPSWLVCPTPTRWYRKRSSLCNWLLLRTRWWRRKSSLPPRCSTSHRYSYTSYREIDAFDWRYMVPS